MQDLSRLSDDELRALYAQSNGGPAPVAPPAPTTPIIVRRADPGPEIRAQNADARADAQLALSQAAAARAAAAAARDGLPNPGVGFRLRADGTAEPIPGGPADTAAASPDQTAGIRTDALDKIALARRLIARSRGEWFGTGALAPIVSSIPGTSAADIAADVETLRAGGAITQVMSLAQANGGKNPLTPLSNADMTMLGNSLANLDTGQSDEQFQRNVQQIINLYERAYLAAGGTAESYTAELAGRLTPEEKQDHINALVRRNASPDEVRAAATRFFGADNQDIAGWLQRYESGDRQPVTVAPMPTDGGPPAGPAGGNPQADIEARRGSNFDAYIRSAANMATGGLGNKAVAIANTFLPLDRMTGRPVYSVWDGSSISDAFNRNLALENRTDNADAVANPVATTAGAVTGGILGAGLMARALPATASTSAFAPAALGADAAYGASIGGNYAFDRGQDVLPAAALGGVLGPLGGMVGRGVVAPAIGRAAATAPGQAVANTALAGANSIRNAGRGMMGRSPLPAPRITPPPQVTRPQDMLLRNIDDPQAAMATLGQADSLGLPMALADTSPGVRRLAGAAFRRSGDEVRAAADATVRGRSLGQADRALGQIESNLGPIGNPNRIHESLMDAARTNSRPLYEAALARPAPVDPALEAMLQTPAGRAALGRASTIAQNEGLDPMGLGFGMDDLGQITLERAPTYRTLDYIKKGFDAELEPLRNPMTGAFPTDPSTQAMLGLRANFRTRLDQLNPEYGAARAAFGGPASSAEAMRDGQRTFLGSQPRDIQDTLARLTPEQGEQYRLGARVALGDRVNSAAYSRNPYEAIYGSPTAQARIDTAFPEGAPRFGQAYNIEREMGLTSQELLGGSPTAQRLAADGEFNGGAMGQVGDALVDTAVAGVPVRFPMRVAQNMLGDRLRMGMMGNARRRADALLPDLLNTNPQASRQMLEEALANQGLRTAYNARMRPVGGGIGLGLGSAIIPFTGQ